MIEQIPIRLSGPRSIRHRLNGLLRVVLTATRMVVERTLAGSCVVLVELQIRSSSEEFRLSMSGV